MTHLRQGSGGQAQLDRLDWILQKAEIGESRLTDWERKFVDDMAQRRAHLGDRLNVSERQWEILEAIAEKAA